MSAVVTAVAELAKANQDTATPEPGTRDTNVTGNPDTESAFITEVYDTSNTYKNICSVWYNVDVTSGPIQLEEANLFLCQRCRPFKTYITVWDTSLLIDYSIRSMSLLCSG